MFGRSQKFANLRHSDLSTRINRSRGFFGSEVGDSIDDARDIGKLSKSSKYENDGSVSDDDPDFYKFKLKGSGNLKLKFRNEGEESINFSIVNKRGQVVTVDGRRLFEQVGEDDKESLDVRLGKGTYYLRIETEDGNNEDYFFKLKFKSSSNNDDDD